MGVISTGTKLIFGCSRCCLLLPPVREAVSDSVGSCEINLLVQEHNLNHHRYWLPSIVQSSVVILDPFPDISCNIPDHFLFTPIGDSMGPFLATTSTITIILCSHAGVGFPQTPRWAFNSDGTPKGFSLLEWGG